MTAFGHAGIRLKTARIAAGFKSAREFCHKYEISSSTYSLHESGGRNLKPKIAKKYSELLGINASWLLTGEGEPYSNKLALDMPVTNEEFMELLKYQGNDKVKASLYQKIEFLDNVNPFIFCKLVIKLMEVLKHLKFELDDIEFTHDVIEIYKDIKLSSDEEKSQLTMIELAVTTYKRQIQDRINSRKKIKHG